jgi:sterol desaturase/sphingolipid hydroxylase (fatty acid hydroxylase superfamily)
MDLTVIATPFYFGSMAVEHKVLQRRARENGPSRGDYEKDDTIASLTMGTASLVAPYAAKALAKRVRIGRGRPGAALLGAAVGTAAAVAVADRLARSPRDTRLHRAARRFAEVGGPAAVAVGGATITTTWATEIVASKLFPRRVLPDLGAGPLARLAAIAGWDFIYYWNHRFMHESRYMWAIHVVHHSSERYNLSTALRQPVADILGTFAPYGLLSLFGVRPELILEARGVNLLYQYWIHTETIGKLGAAERVLNTPSAHRVHHGSNQQYIDRNHGSILIVWDKLFGTFEPEGEPVVYGLTKNIDTFNPIRIATHEYVDILRDVARSRNWKDRVSFVFRGPGWAYDRHRRDGVTATAEEAVAA